jgi:hypothetical protein
VLSRRALLRTGLLVSAQGAVAPLLRGVTERSAPARLTLESKGAGVVVPDNFIGLGYEMSSVAQPGLLDARNVKYVQLVRNLGSSGVLRLGGIVSDFTRYAAHGSSADDCKNTVITDANLVQLRGFLDAIGWTAVWSVNFGRGSLADAIVEARAVHRILGPRLAAIELGNEVENYGHGSSPLRKPPYTYDEYLAEFRRWHRGLVAVVPKLRFAAPDTAGSVAWVEQMAGDAHGEVQLLTTHYYRGDQRKGTREQLMTDDPALASELDRLRTVSRASGIPWRMCETNSFYGGGRPGLSDTFAASLWTLRYLLLLAESGCAGVNLETGINQLGFMSSYSPIEADSKGSVEAGASYYGMLAFAAAGVDGGEILPVSLSPADRNLIAYGIGRRGEVRSVVLINRSETESRSVTVAGIDLDAARALWLSAPSMNSREGITFGNVPVDGEGKWRRAETARVRENQIAMPPASSVVLKV